MKVKFKEKSNWGHIFASSLDETSTPISDGKALSCLNLSRQTKKNYCFTEVPVLYFWLIIKRGIGNEAFPSVQSLGEYKTLGILLSVASFAHLPSSHVTAE